MRKFLFVFLAMAAMEVWSAPYVFSPSASLTTGPTSLPYFLHGVSHNPAAAELVIFDEETFRYGYLSTLGLGYEVGEVSNFEEDLDDLIDVIDGNSTGSESSQEVLDRFNTVLQTMENDGYLKTEAAVGVPGLPFVYRSEIVNGTLSLDVAYEAQVRLGLLYDTLTYNQNSSDFETNSSLYLKSGTLFRAGVGFSREVWSKDVGHMQGKLLAGSRVNLYRMSLSKQVFWLKNLSGKSVSDVIRDERDRNENESSGFGLDVGLIWETKHFNVGVTVTNLNEPEFDFGSIGVNCSSISDSSSRDNCEVANHHIQVLGNIDSTETHVMSALTTVDVSYFIRDNWMASFSHELGDYNDMVGDEIQMTTLSTNYFPRNRWFPTIRFGYKKNRAGSELSSMSIGTTIIDLVNVDVEWGFDDVDIDGDSGPRLFGLNIGFEKSF